MPSKAHCRRFYLTYHPAGGSAKVAAFHIYVAMAPTYPECGAADMRATLKAVAELAPITIFMEPINIRAENVARIAAAT